MVLEKYYQKANQIPAAVKSFLFKGLIIFVAWKLIYLLFLAPGRILDEPLTSFTGINAARVLNLFTHSAGYTAKAETDVYKNNGLTEIEPLVSIYYKQDKALSIADVCNVLELLVLYVGFIICYPRSLKRKTLFAIGGVITICLVNILRCAALAWVFIYYPQYADFSHHYLFTFIVYLFIFMLWFWFSKTTHANAKV